MLADKSFMITQRSTEVRVGIVSVLAIALLIAGIMLGKGLGVGVNYVLSFHFPSSGGIDIGAPVTVNGVRRGAVTSIENSDGGVLLTATVSGIDDLYANAGAVISMLEITGGKKIEITPGSGAQKLDPAQVIPGRTAPDIGELLVVVDKLGASADKVLLRVDTLLGTVNGALADGQIVSNVRESADKLNKLLSSADKLISDNRVALNQTVSDVQVIASQLRRMVDKHSPTVDTLLTKLDIALTDARTALGSIERVAGNADRLIDDVDGLVRDIKTNGGLANKLLYDEKFSMRLDSTVQRLEQFLYKVDEHGVNVNLRIGTRP